MLAGMAKAEEKVKIRKIPKVFVCKKGHRFSLISGNTCPICGDEGRARRTLADIELYPQPQELYEAIMGSEGWPYKVNRDEYLRRDRALVALLYLCALRVSEALRLRKSQFRILEDRVEVEGIKLSKMRRKGKPRRHKFRVAWLPLTGERAVFTQLVLEYLETLREDEPLFKFSRQRAQQVVTRLTGKWCHYLRALGEEYLYSKWRGDLLAIADYVKVNPTVLGEYIRERYRSHEAV
jgi:integrase